MNYSVISQAHKAINLTPPEKSVLLHLAIYADENGANVYPSKVTLSELTGYSRKTVRLAIENLEAAGILSKQPGEDKKPVRGPKGQYKYKINLEMLETRQPAKRRPSNNATEQNAPIPEDNKPVYLVTSEPPNNNHLVTSEPPQAPGLVTSEPQLTNIKDLTNSDLKDLNNYRQKEKKNYRQNAEKNESGTYPEKQVKSPEVKTQNGEIPKPPSYELFKAGFDRNSKIAKTYPWGVMQVRDFIDLVNEFNANRVTAEDFSNAVKNQDANGGYENTSSPKSYRKRAYSEREKRLTGRYPNPASDKHPANRINQSISGIGWKANSTDPAPEFTPDPIENEFLEINASYETPEPEPKPEPPINPRLLELTNQAIAAMEGATGKPYDLQPKDREILEIWLNRGVTGRDIAEYLADLENPMYLYFEQVGILMHVNKRKPETPQPITAPTPEAAIDPIPFPAETERERLETNSRLELAEMIRQFRESKTPAYAEVMR